jgi:NADH:ubiquinone oxidoreductase subunit K
MGANSAYAATVTYDAADITGTITNIQTTAVAVMGAFITLGLTVMFYRKIRGLASRG